MNKMHPNNFERLLEKANTYLKENGDLDPSLHITSLSIEENLGQCVRFIDVPERRRDPDSGKPIIVMVRKCVQWA